MPIIYFILILFPIIIFGSEPKRELRAVWIASVFNIDWPSNRYLSIEKQKSEMIKILDTLSELKFNAAILQIKPTSDAFYQSQLSPWSIFLTGSQGKDPEYDPLKFFITEAQKRAIETHVWVNPYRILNGEKFNTLCKNHIARKNPDWVIEYNKRYYFDPGNPKIQQYIIKEILEIVKNYDIDVLHMDDYFYPYKVIQNGKILHFNDDISWKKYGQKFQSRSDWRRDNVNSFVQKLSKEIKNNKKHVKFGISPFGVWRNKSIDPKGSDTQAGQTNYDDLYADVLTWIKYKWIDYVMPQIYWHFDTKSAPYDILVKWWNDIVQDQVNLYIGIGIYKLGEQNWPVTHIKKQVDFKRKLPYIDGAAYYSAKWIIHDTKNIQNYIKQEVYPHYALVPKNKNIEECKPFQVNSFKLIESNNSFYLSWENNDPDMTHYFVIYKFKIDEQPDINKAENIIGKVSVLEKLEFQLPKHTPEYTYGITAVSRLHNESIVFTLEDEEKQQNLKIIDKLLEEDSLILE